MMTERWQTYRHCPRCGAAAQGVEPPAPFRCGACDYTTYFNPVCAIAVFILDDAGRALFIRRGREPSLGKLAPAGGFIDLGETAEQACRREIQEEVGLGLLSMRYLGSWPNRYHTKDFVVNVLDFFFVAQSDGSTVTEEVGEVAGHVWLDPLSVSPTEMAFPSMQAALEAFQAELRAADR
jgi:NAD+ diphosphatase